MFAPHHTLRLILPAAICIFCTATIVSCKEFTNEPSASNKQEVQVSKHRQQDEKRAARYLERARWAMNEGDYDAARQLIGELRDSCYLALDARERAMLLLDSIELYAAMSDTTLPDHETRVQFYQKKLEYDKQAPRKHEIKK